jgi:glycerophosphoryl diester phosphodiesterase
MTQKRTLIWGHRGASFLQPENTISAFEKALQIGVDGIEFDVRLCKDGEVVVFHDPQVDRLTDGKGWVKNLSLNELKKLKITINSNNVLETVPTLKEVFNLVKDKIYMDIEIKAETFRNIGIEQKVVNLVKEFNLRENIIVSSFSPVVLRRFHLIAPEIKIGFIYSDNTFFNRWFAKRFGIFSWHPASYLVNERSLAKARRLNREVHAWTVDNTQEMKRLIKLGIDGIISNKPEVLKEIVFNNLPLKF